MSCCCCCCAGPDGCSSLLSLILGLTFTFHVLGALSPAWYCKGANCELEGLYYNCDGIDCKRNAVPDVGILSLVFLVLGSSFLNMLTFCIATHCTSYRIKPLTPIMMTTFGGWFVLQELMTTIILIIIGVQYDTLGWSAYCFTVPGMSLMAVAILMLLYQCCWPEKTVQPVV